VTALPERLSPLAGWSDRFAAASSADERFAIRELPFLAQINLRGGAADRDFNARVTEVLGFDLPNANTWSGSAARGALWLGPDEWLIVAQGEEPAILDEALRQMLRGLHHSVVDLSANRTVIEMKGREARLVLAKGMPLELHARGFAPSAVAQSLLARTQAILQALDDRPTFRLFVRPSFAAYVAEWLLDAAAECAASRGLDADRLLARLA
jgi:sarcosine oxidase subunit gamma